MPKLTLLGLCTIKAWKNKAARTFLKFFTNTNNKQMEHTKQSAENRIEQIWKRMPYAGSMERTMLILENSELRAGLKAGEYPDVSSNFSPSPI